MASKNRKELLTYPRLQAKWVGMILSLVAFTALLVFVSIDMAIQRAGADPTDLFVTAEGVRVLIRTPFYIAAILSLIAAGLVALYQLHGLLGPIKALEGALYRMQKGEFTKAFHIREADDLHDFASEVRAMQEGMKSRILKDRERALALKKIVDEAAGRLPSEQAKLKQDLQFVSKELETLTSGFDI